MATETYEKIFERNKFNLHKAARQSATWFQQQVLLLQKQNITPSKLMRSQDDLTARIVPGNMYMFFYDAKHKDTLPYWDRFPLVFPYKKTEDGFMGLNMHYLPYQLRFQLLDRLSYFKNNTRWDETTKLKYSWDLINGVSKYKAAEPCIKRYLTAHVRSSFKKVNSPDWAAAMMLPVESFVGANKQTVWQESKRQINR